MRSVLDAGDVVSRDGVWSSCPVDSGDGCGVDAGGAAGGAGLWPSWPVGCFGEGLGRGVAAGFAGIVWPSCCADACRAAENTSAITITVDLIGIAYFGSASVSSRSHRPLVLALFLFFGFGLHVTRITAAAATSVFCMIRHVGVFLSVFRRA